MQMDDPITMKLDTITISGRRLRRDSSETLILALQQKLRKFFDEADGHGSLMRRPPSTMITPQYFKIANTTSCYPIRRIDWMAFVNTSNYKKQITSQDDSFRIIQRPTTILNGQPTKK